MKTLAKYHVCNHCVIGDKTFKNILIGPVSYRDFDGPQSLNFFFFFFFFFNISQFLLALNTKF